MTRFSPFRLNRWDALAAFALFALTAGVYAPSYGFDFVNFDDPDYVIANPHVFSGLNADNVGWAFTTIYAANWHPLTWLSLQGDAALWGLNPAGYHLTNFLLHALNAALVYLIFRAATGAAGRSAALAALWTLHPLHVESVAWVSERKDLLCAFFWLLTMLAYVRYTAAPSWRRFLPVMLGLVLALLAKPMAVTLPCALILCDIWPLGRVKSLKEFGQSVQEKLSLFVLVFAACGMTFYAQSFGGAVRGFNDIDPATRLMNVMRAYAIYLGQTVWPVNLAPFYPLPKETPVLLVGVSVSALLALTGIAVVFLRKAPYLLVGWLWFLGTQVPVIGLVHVGEQAHADRYVYLPHVGLFAALVWGAAELATRLRVPFGARAAVVVALVVLLAFLTYRQLSHWRNSLALWGHAAAIYPDNVTARTTLGKAYMNAGDLEAALRCFEEAIQLEPLDFDANRMRAIALVKLGRWYDKAGGQPDINPLK